MHDVGLVASWADAVVTLPGHENSVGATAEIAVAKFAEIPVITIANISTYLYAVSG